MFSSKAGWHLPFALLTVTFLFYVSVAIWFTGWLSASQARPPHALDGILSPETIDALYEDARLHRTILELTEAVAKASVSYGENYQSGGLKDFGKSLTAEATRMKAANVPSQRKRQFLGIGQGQKDETQGGILSGLTGLLGGNGTAGLGDLFQQGLSGITGSIVDGLATPAYFLGIGLGMGAETGLNLTTQDESKAIATKVAASAGQQPTGINLVAQNLGTGLSAQLAPALGNMSTSDLPIGMVAFALAQGIGQGSASGLNLTQQQFLPTNSSDIMAIAKNFGLGVTGPIASSAGVQKLLNQAGGGTDFMAQIPQIAAAAGHGLGQGASSGLGLSKSGTSGFVVKRQSSLNPSQMDIPGIVGNLTFGLSQSFLESSNLTMLLGSSGGGFSLDNSSLILLATGAGKGIGEGIALGLNPNGSTALASMAVGGSNQTEEQVAEQFTKNLVASLLQNGGMTAIGESLTSQAGGLTANVDMAKAAEGAARGLVEGSVSALSEAGGLQKVIAGDFPEELAMNLPSLPQTKFNDSLNGSVVAFTRGLSGEGVLLISKLLNSGKNTSTAPPAKRNIDASGVGPYSRLTRRAEAVTPAIDDQTLQGLAQSGVNTITCSGFGGLAALALGIMQSPALKGKTGTSASPPLDNSTLAALPKGPVTIVNEGNTFTINIAEQAVTINGLQLKPFAILTALHAFFFALPAYFALGAIWRFSDMIGHPINDAKMRKWRVIVLFGLFTPLATIGIILGIVGKGSAAHFHTAHGIFGLVAFIFLFPSVIVGFIRLRTTVPIPPPSAFLFRNQIAAMKGPHKIHIIANILIQQTLAFGMISWIQGFSDLRSISLCVVDAVLTAPTVVGVLNLILFMQIGATSLLIARFILERRIAKNGAGEHGDVVYFEKGGKNDHKRTDTIKTFGFDSSPASEPIPARRTADLLGKEDSRIGWPVDARKFGEEDPIAATVRDTSTSPNPFMNPAEQLVSPRVYNAKLGGFEDERSPAFPVLPPTNAINNPPAAQDQFRPSSELDPQSRYVSYATPRVDEREMSGAPGPTLRRYESFSRPLTRVAAEDNLRVREERTAANQYGYGSGDGR
ncbi:hypothetical protein N0V90_011282 [Kalmusia sp. IMI 367209]|nr:hypothetical protein N0V90_011282 [Kalmusia sp. IMI 367209]